MYSITMCILWLERYHFDILQYSVSFHLFCIITEQTLMMYLHKTYLQPNFNSEVKQNSQKTRAKP